MSTIIVSRCSACAGDQQVGGGERKAGGGRRRRPWDQDIDESSRAPTTQPSWNQSMVLWDGHAETARDSTQSRGHSIRIVDSSRCEKTIVDGFR